MRTNLTTRRVAIIAALAGATLALSACVDRGPGYYSDHYHHHHHHHGGNDNGYGEP